MKKKMYEKPQIEVVEIQLSDCIAGSAGMPGAATKGTANSYNKDERSSFSGSAWQSWTD